MSHVTNINLEIKDLGALRDACAALGLEFREGQTTYRWFGEHVGDYPLPKGFKASDLGKCDHAIALPNNKNAYEVGVVRARDGSDGYVLQWDFWSGGYGLQAAIGNDANKLRQEYAVAVAASKARAKGFRVQRTTNDVGNIILRATR